eukprot:comp5284_c0_seq1/m.4458 comp5284_c0_seq1/g.4458  ORF comp5284_c0_seq1/g.4458 comp5284_c0_seq1/m.4458 type:complete len:351 (-) comp5284_c0_seq1:31-1083(-)
MDQVVASVVRGGNNVCFSPISLTEVVRMIVSGSSGLSQQQLMTLFRAEISRHPVDLTRVASASGIICNLSRALFVHAAAPINHGFVQSTGATVQSVDFGSPSHAVALINQTISGLTHNQIPRLIPDGAVNPLTRVVAVSTVVFKGKWAHAFPPQNTIALGFNQRGGAVLQLPFMCNQTSVEFSDDSQLGPGAASRGAVAKLPYVGEQFAMRFFLPNPGCDVGQIDIRTALAAQLTKRDVRLMIPRFKVRTDLALAPVLQQIGCTAPFGPTHDFSPMTAPHPNDWYISQIFQSCLVEVSEEGTTAIAATAAVIRTRAMVPQFFCDRPFKFAITYEPTGEVLFCGTVENPSS